MRGLGRMDAATPEHTTDSRALKLMWPFLWPSGDPGMRTRLVASVLLLALTAALNALAPLLFARGIDVLSGQASAVLVVPVGLLLAYGAVHTMGKGLSEMRWLLYGPIEQRLKRNIGLSVFRHVHDLSLRFHISRRTGQLSRVLDNGTRGIDQILFGLVFNILPLMTELVFIVVVLLREFEPLFTVIIVGTGLLYTVALVIGSSWLRVHQRRAVIEGAAAHGKAVDSLLNYETVKYFGNERYVAERYDTALQEVEQLQVKALVARSITGFVQVVILGSGLTVMILLAGARVSAGEITLGGLVLVNTYLLQILRPLDRMGMLYRNLKQAFTEVEQMMSLLAEEPEITDLSGAPALPPGPGAIAFRDVSFAYDARRPVLEKLSFEIRAGHTLGLVGLSGAGKTTVGRLLFRFYDPTAGAVEMDGQDIRGVAVDSLRAAVGVVPQDSVLFNDSLAYNISFGDPGCPPEEIERAARVAQIHDFIATLPDGYETVVGERGLKLSGGEKQRVAIARAVLKRPRIFLFDEATSALDTKTERAIQESLFRVSKGTTTLIIAHRLSSVVHADQILVIEDGRAIERGTHDSLLRDGGRYAALWAKQQQRLELDAAD